MAPDESEGLVQGSCKWPTEESPSAQQHADQLSADCPTKQFLSAYQKTDESKITGTPKPMTSTSESDTNDDFKRKMILSRRRNVSKFCTIYKSPEYLVSKFASQLPALSDMISCRNDYNMAGCKKKTFYFEEKKKVHGQPLSYVT